MIEVPPQSDSSVAAQVEDLARVLQREFGGPTAADVGHGAVGTAIRLLRQQHDEIDRLNKVQADLRFALTHESARADQRGRDYHAAVRVAAEYRQTIQALRTVVSKLTEDPFAAIAAAHAAPTGSTAVNLTGACNGGTEKPRETTRP